ncbi:GIY-YIG nuclease family protein [Naasia lichenicola]|uniref:GIY-YIG nuclease family protein n=1 Tax=Naasia lichenicola TaxID=2565933 RepID=UPI001E363808|nr:GIY-YIG nuclease family protein [Naasia lichenicola]
MVASSDADPSTCAIPGCLSASDDPAAISLCADHLAIAAELHGLQHGASDPLPEPCVLCGSRLGIRLPTGWTCAVCEWPYGEHPDAEFAAPRVDVVYYLRYGDRVKIGTTVSPRQRFAALWHDEVLAFERGDRRLEHRRHQQFHSARAGTSEWFHLTDEIRAHVDVLAGGVDPWDRWRRWMAEATAIR